MVTLYSPNTHQTPETVFAMIPVIRSSYKDHQLLCCLTWSDGKPLLSKGEPWLHALVESIAVANHSSKYLPRPALLDFGYQRRTNVFNGVRLIPQSVRRVDHRGTAETNISYFPRRHDVLVGFNAGG